MAVTNFIPILWAGQLLKNLNNVHVAKECCNRDYEGELKNQGDTIKITSVGRITITTHVRNTDITAAEQLTTAQLSLVVDQGQHFNFQLDDVDEKQIAGNVLPAAMEEAAWGMADSADRYIIDMLYDGVATASPDNLDRK